MIILKGTKVNVRAHSADLGRGLAYTDIPNCTLQEDCNTDYGHMAAVAHPDGSEFKVHSFSLRPASRGRNQMMADVRAAIRTNYTSIGSYPLFVYTADGEMIHPACVKTEYRSYSESTRHNHTSSYIVTAVDVYWEGPAIECPVCGKPCESAYGDPEPDADTEEK